MMAARVAGVPTRAPTLRFAPLLFSLMALPAVSIAVGGVALVYEAAFSVLPAPAT